MQEIQTRSRTRSGWVALGSVLSLLIVEASEIKAPADSQRDESSISNGAPENRTPQDLKAQPEDESSIRNPHFVLDDRAYYSA